MDIPMWLWILVFSLVAVFLAIDLVSSKEEITRKQAWVRSVIWIAVGVAFGGVIWFTFTPELAQQYWSGFVTEKALSIDNVFVWAIIFTTFAIPKVYQQRILMLGIISALVFRAIAIALGATLIENFAITLYVFAAFLIWTGIKMLAAGDHEKSPLDSKFWKLLNARVPSVNNFYGKRFLVRINGKVFITPLLAVLLLVEFTDVLFAVDSIPAVFAVTDEPFLVFTSNAFALLGLRSLYFVLADLMHRFAYLKTGLALILVWVGVKMALHDLVKVPTLLSLAIIVFILLASIVISIVITKRSTIEAHEPEKPQASFTEASAEQKLLAKNVWGR
jgi:tellurite resistance protein TerC